MPKRSKTAIACRSASPGHRWSRCTRISADVRASASATAPAEVAAAAPATATTSTGEEDDAARPTPAARAAGPALAPRARGEHGRQEHRPQAREDDQGQGEGEEARSLLPAGRRRARVGARDRLVDGVEPGRDAIADLALAEARRHRVAEYLARQRVREPGLEAVADLEAHLPVVEEDQEDDAVVEAFLADPPRLRQPNRVVLEAFALERAEDGHDDLVARALLARPEHVLETGALAGGQRARVVSDAVVGSGRDGQRRDGDRRRGEQERQDSRQPQAHGAAAR